MGDFLQDILYRIQAHNVAETPVLPGDQLLWQEVLLC